MGINIKNTETERLIRELAEMTGEGKTQAIGTAVRERINRLQAKSRAEQRYKAMTEIAEEIAPLLKDFDMDDALYGPDGLYDRETGLPK
ncbi:MAG: type II toxin-antitoxin system VapB family antitoxin [Bauldia sp.]